MASSALAQTPPPQVDGGSFLIMRGADTIGVETFTVTRTNDAINITTATYFPVRRPRIVIEGTLRLNPDSSPAVLTLEAAVGDDWRVVAQFGTRRVTFRRQTPTRESAREYPAESRTLIAHDSVFAFYAILPGHSDGPITLTLPATDTRISYRLTALGPQTTTVEGTRQTLDHYTLASNTDVRHLWFREGKIQKIEIPTSGLTIHRTQSPARIRR
jgi:hypothetical protein